MPCLSLGKQMNFSQSTVSSWGVPAKLCPAQSPQQGRAPPMERKMRQHISNFFRATQYYVGTVRLLIMVVFVFTSIQ